MPRYPGISPAHQGLSARVYTSLLTLAEAHAPEVFALNVGDTSRPPAFSPRPSSLDAHDASASGASCLASTSAKNPRLYNYAAVQGDPLLLDAIVADLARRDRPVARERIQVTAGATSGLDLVFRTLLVPGDEVIVLAPFWPLVRGIVSAAGGVAVELPFFTELRKSGFDLRSALERVVTPRTVALYVNHPHNPTGVVLRPDEQQAIAAFVAERDLWLVSDEAYEHLYFSAQAPAALWMQPAVRERAVVAHTFSKSYGVAGARVGFVHGPAPFMEALMALQTYATYCAPRPMQVLLAELLESASATRWLAEARAAYAEAGAATAFALNIPAPESGTFVIFDTRAFLRPDETPADLLARCARRGVVLTPGAATGAAYADHARLCFTAVDPAVLKRALEVLRRELSS
jgi:N-succinyldiaminopimelate aminotransferase